MIPTQYRIKLLLSVFDAWKYNSTTAMLSVMILPVNVTPPAPSLSSIRLSDNGNGVYIVFTMATYCGGIESTLSYWSCDIVLTIASDEKARCSWHNNKTTILVSLLHSSSLSVEDLITIKGGIISAECISGHNCAIYESRSETNLTIAASLLPVFSVVVIVSLSEFTEWSDVVMDIGASSGNGGRPWKSIVWQAHGNIIPTIEWYLVIVLQWLGLLGLPSTLTSSLTLYGSAVIALCTNILYYPNSNLNKYIMLELSMNEDDLNS